MALLKERGDSFAVSMSLAEMAFLIIFVLLLLTTLSELEDRVPNGDNGTAGDNGAAGMTAVGGPGTVPEPDSQSEGEGPNPPPDPTESVLVDNGIPRPEPGGGGATSLGPNGPGEPGDAGSSPSVSPQTEGVGPPPCWTDATGNIEYLYNIVIHQDRYDVKKAWPSDRDRQAAEFDAGSLVGSAIDLEAFVVGAAPVREWSDEQTPPCRHYFYVHVQDVANLQLLLRAEDFMYKFIDRESR